MFLHLSGILFTGKMYMVKEASVVKGACVAKGGMHGEGGVHGRGHVWWGNVWQRACVAGETSTAVHGTHPTGMHFCWESND